MSKGNNRRGNREAKKPKQPKKPAATAADYGKGTTPVAALASKRKP